MREKENRRGQLEEKEKERGEEKDKGKRREMVKKVEVEEKRK